MRNWLSLLIPPLGAAALLLFEPTASQVALSLMLWMVMWWVLEVMPLGITALLPLVYLPLTGVMELKLVASAYANPTIYLFLGGFVIARGLEKTLLNERIALNILKVTGRSDGGIILGFMIATSFLSMWISNTATTVMMVPIALSVVDFLTKQLAENQKTTLKTFSIVLFLTIAYSANMGGIFTPVGTPPNVVLLGFLEEIYNIEIDFWRWMMAVSPIGIVVLGLQFFLLRRIFHYNVPIDQRFRKFAKAQVKSLGPLNRQQKITLVVFCLVAFLWIFKGSIHYLLDTKFLNDTSIAITGAILLFLLPTNTKDFTAVLGSKDIAHLPWNIILLFGGGMAMAGALKQVGLIEMTATYLANFDMGSPYVLVFVLALASLFLTEIMSNVALCVVALPVFMELGVKTHLSPIVVGMITAICASMAFSMPVSTPPNAIVFGTNMIRVKDMMRAGILLNLIGVSVVMSLGWLSIHFFFQ